MTEEVTEFLYSFPIYFGIATVLLQPYLKFMYNLALIYSRTNPRCFSCQVDQLLTTRTAITFQMAEQVNSFEKVGFTLSILSVNNVKIIIPDKIQSCQITIIAKLQIF